MKVTKICSQCKIQKNLSKSSWFANSKCGACHARNRYPTNTKRKEYKKTWREQNKEHHRRYMREYKQHRIDTDVQYKLKNALRKRLTEAVKNNAKGGSAVKMLGCSISELKSHLEVKFEHNMNWDNYGKWHIDHVKPLSLFDLTDPKQVAEACNFSNLSPMWAIDNIRKSNHYG